MYILLIFAMNEQANMSINKEVKTCCTEEEDEEDLEMLRLMALQSRKNKVSAYKTSPLSPEEKIENESEDSDSSVDSLDRLIQDMDYELLDTPKEERVYLKKKKFKKTRNDKEKLVNTNVDTTIATDSVQNEKECSKNDMLINKVNENAKMAMDENSDVNTYKIEAVGSRIPTLTETIPLNVNVRTVNHIPPIKSEPLLNAVPIRSRSRSWSRESSPYRRSRFSRSPERRTPSRSIFPDLTNVQLSPRALAFVYNNTGILIKRRDRRSSSSTTRDYFSSDSSSRSRRSISPYLRSYKPSSPQPSYSGQMHSTTSSRRSRSNSRPKSRLALAKQGPPYKTHPRPPRRQQFREGTRKCGYKNEPTHNQRRQRSCSISLSPSPEPMIKAHPINFSRNNYMSCHPGNNRLHKYNYRNVQAMTNDSKMNSEFNKPDRSNRMENIKTGNANKKSENPAKSDDTSNNSGVPDHTPRESTEGAKPETINESMDDGIELTLDASVDDVWSSESSDDEREGRFKTCTKNTKPAPSSKISFSAKTTVKPPCVSLDEIINKRPMRNSDDSKKNLGRSNRINKDSWGQSSKLPRGARSPHMRYRNNSRRVNNMYNKSSSDNLVTRPLPNKVTPLTVDKPVHKETVPNDGPETKKSDPTSKAASIRAKPNEAPECKAVPTESKTAETVKINKNIEAKHDEDLRDTLQQRRVKHFGPMKTQTSSSRLVQSALIGAVTSQSGASKRINESRPVRNENDAGNSLAKKSRNNDLRRVQWVKPEEKQDKDEEKSRMARLPVRLRLGIGDSSKSVPRKTSSNRRRRNRGFANKQYNDDVHQV